MASKRVNSAVVKSIKGIRTSIGSNTRIPESKKPKPFPIVAFGASAGGLEAFTAVLKTLSPHLGMAYVLIMHLSPNHKSALTEIVRTKTRMKVQKVEDGMEVKVNNIYVIPPNTFMSIVDGHLKLAPRLTSSLDNFAVDYFFNGLASVYKNNAIGVILSGTGSDGTLGLKAIKAEGGIAFAQDKTAEFSGMPQSAKDSGYVDFMLSPAGIAKELARLVKIPYTILPPNLVESSHHHEIIHSVEDLKSVLSIVKIKTGIDFFLHYKQASIYRRVARRMVLNNVDKLANYASLLKANPKEIDALYDDFLINVTKFFRDADFFELLATKIFSLITKQKKVGEPIRIWVAGCATGEEAYSVAISLCEYMEKNKLAFPVQIFASDLDINAIEKARLGIYPAGALMEIPQNYLKRYFKKLDGHYQVVRSIRETCIFSQHNLLKDPPFSRMDLISCQNVLIYLETSPQKKILQTFHYALKSAGFLYLAKSETVGASNDVFESIDKKARLYKRKQNSINSVPVFPLAKDSTVSQNKTDTPSRDLDVERDLNKLMLSRFVYPSIVVNKNLLIVQFFGATSSYLSPVAGKASLNVLKMIREDLSIDLRNLLQQAKKTDNVASKEGISIYNKKQQSEIAIEVIPKVILGDPFFIVVFKEHVMAPISLRGNGASSKSESRAKAIVKLEAELVQSLEVIRTTNEEYETTYEELQANNEELLSSNEELQSVNEELESSKEELQSSNEELTTIVDELHKRNGELKDSYEYTDAIVETMHGPLLVLTANLEVRKANKSFYKTFDLSEEKTEGSFIYDLGDGAWDIPSLRTHLKEFFPNKTNFKEFEIKHDFPGIGERELIVNAYKIVKSENSKETLILLIFDDITRQFTAEASLLKTQAQLKLSLIGDLIGTWWWNINTGEMKWSRENELLNRIKEGTFKGHYRDWEKLIHRYDLAYVKRGIKKSIDQNQILEIEYRIPWTDKGFRWILSKGQVYYDEKGKPERMVGVSMDYTDKKMQSENLEEQVSLRTSELLNANRELEKMNVQLEQFAFVSSHDLQEPLRKIEIFADLMNSPEADLNEYAKVYSGKISASAHRMSTLIKDLLNFSSLARGSDKKLTKVDLNAVLKDVMTDFDVIIESKGASVTYAGLPVIEAERIQMYQLFHNLVSNAFKFSKEKPEIKIFSNDVTEEDFKRFSELRKDEVYVCISVADNGVGFDQKYASRIFILFQKLKDIKNASGTGLGLALCKQIVEDHHGFIFAEGKEKVGATFRVFLPIKQHSSSSR